jgi:hypothetical protein
MQRDRIMMALDGHCDRTTLDRVYQILGFSPVPLTQLDTDVLGARARTTKALPRIFSSKGKWAMRVTFTLAPTLCLMQMCLYNIAEMVGQQLGHPHVCSTPPRCCQRQPLR